ncbi:MAG TPA: shikimate dehydrogenase [Chthoniobacteraceae bacterium]|nr:shikimate dehydrogenase [Chthoniobacteraceae bacterium]
MAAAEVYSLHDLERWSEATAGINPPLRLAVCGDPVAHSASPPMHNAALEALGIDARYTRLHLRAEDLPRAFQLLREIPFTGVNCTIPHKLAALELVDVVDASARRAGGVNTVQVTSDGHLIGHSTDGPGFSRAVREAFGGQLSGMRVAVLGAGGGAGRAIAMQCAFEGAAALALINRTVEKIETLSSEIRREFPLCEVSIHPSDPAIIADPLARTDVIVNCTALGMKPGDASPLPTPLISSRHLIYDSIYTSNRTPLMLAADGAGARSANGLSMLLHQGALAFEIWFGRQAPIEVMRAALR